MVKGEGSLKFKVYSLVLVAFQLSTLKSQISTLKSQISTYWSPVTDLNLLFQILDPGLYCFYIFSFWKNL